MTEPRFSSPEEHLPLTSSVLQILLALSRTPQHGYAIMKDVAHRSDGLTLLPGTLYRALARLQENGLVKLVKLPAPPDADLRRRNYRLTDLGIRVLKCELSRLEKDVRIGRERLAGGTST